MKSAGGIDDDDVRASCPGGGNTVKNNTGGVAAFLVADYVGAGALRPDGELLGSRGTEGITGAEKHLFSLGLEAAGKLSDGGSLTNTVYTYHKDNGGLARKTKLPLPHIEYIAEDLAEGLSHLFAASEPPLMYTRQCSLGVTATQLSTMAATIACGGYNPKTKKTVFPGNLTSRITSLMATVGFYERTGDWMFSCGLPAKSGVGGGIMGVLPGAFGIAAFSPPIDSAGNSVRAQLAIRYIMEELKLHIFGCEKFVMVEKETILA